MPHKFVRPEAVGVTFSRVLEEFRGVGRRGMEIWHFIVYIVQDSCANLI
jgi:hypothetical protein